MKTSDSLSDSLLSATNSPAKCAKCGATTQLHTGVCVSCLLGEGLEPGDEVSRAVFESAIAEVNVPDKQWRLGDYEILDEIGRGGMGVIYLARQRHPQRIVAVKRVLNYHADSHETLKRFRREADAAASLDHPNILPIYEVSESEDGLPFFSMKFATGGSLRKVGPVLRGKPRESVQVMAKVARAIEYAHGHGILHRDLKPGNILLDGRGEPLVSDFGLAKFIDANKDLTKSLTTFGTPGYTAPEQAQGTATTLTPAADVYSLGAILFELLTGRPPFVGDNALAVIRQAAETPAPKLRSLSHSHDRDLETICARCLERDPKARYQSAGDLATDLERWLDGRPIIARPISVPTRLGRWSRRNPKLIATGAACLLFGAATMWFFRGELTRILPTAPEKSVAVLPFENLSGDPDNAYFADGIQEEILTRLASIADLKVISRASTQRYQSKPRNLAEIARQLGVASIVEGSVQKAGDQVRVNVQLVNAQTDSHLWAETYDRKLTDVFGVESEIAKGIANSLQAKLTGSEKQALAVKPTNNPEAYDAFLRGLAIEARNSVSSYQSYDANLVDKAISFYERAVQLEPNFALAWARLSRMHAFHYFNRDDTTPAVRADTAKRALENAQKLEPNSPETLLALGYYQYWVLRDYDAGKTTFGRVRKMLPGSSEVPYALGRVARREGNWDQSIAYFEQALALDPRNSEFLMDSAHTYGMVRQFPAALKLYDRVLDITPNNPDVMAAKASIYQAQGNLPEAASFLFGINEQSPSEETFGIKITQLRLERNYSEAVRLLQAQQTQFHFASQVDKASAQAWLAITQRLAGDAAGAKVTAEATRKTLEQLYRDQPDNYGIAANLSGAHAAMGQKDSALEAAERAVMLLPRTKDAAWGPSREENLALIQTIVGENGRAISILTQLLETPYKSQLYGAPVTPALLRLDPLWDPLRADPAFQKICEEPSIVPEKSIAVLPFENRSEDKANAYFADGVQDEILTRLSKIADLKVISRTSTQHYKGTPKNVPEIARQLGVAHILEGSVQKNGAAVRVNVQLIKAANDSHLWANTYDRKLTDIFGVESEIAEGVAAALQAKLTGREEQALAVKPTSNPEAYDAYLRGLAYNLKTGNANANLLGAQKHLREAVRLDPKFALAWALLAYVDARGYLTTALQPTIALREEARHAAETALTLQPNLGEAVLAKGAYHYFCLKDYDTAVRYIEQARQFLPNSSRIPELLAYITRRRGEQDRSESLFNEAERLDPRDVQLLTQHALSYITLRRFPEALRKLDQVLNITPDDVETLSLKAGIAQAQGDLPRAAALLAPLRPTAVTQALEIQVYQGILERRPALIIPRLKEVLAKPDPALGFFNGELRFLLGWAQHVAGDHAAAQETWLQARSELEPLVKQQPENYLLINDLALTNMGLGDKTAAFALTEQAMAAVPIEKNPFDGPAPIEILARVAAQMGEPDRAIIALRKVLPLPQYWSQLTGVRFTPALLRLDPMFDPLRSDPRFQELCEDKQLHATP